MPRCPRLDAPGTLHHVIARGIERGFIVRDDEDRKAFVCARNTATLTGQASMAGRCFRSCAPSPPERQGGSARIHAATSHGPRDCLYRRHDRHGHLFENRYKSIVCDEDSYFQNWSDTFT